MFLINVRCRWVNYLFPFFGIFKSLYFCRSLLPLSWTYLYLLIDFKETRHVPLDKKSSNDYLYSTIFLTIILKSYFGTWCANTWMQHYFLILFAPCYFSLIYIHFDEFGTPPAFKGKATFWGYENTFLIV